MTFDPDAYLASTPSAGEFDPDAYLAETEPLKSGVLNVAKNGITPVATSKQSIADIAEALPHSDQAGNPAIAGIEVGRNGGISTTTDRATDIAVNRAIAPKGNAPQDTMAETSRYLKGSGSPRISEQDVVTIKPETSLADTTVRDGGFKTNVPTDGRTIGTFAKDQALGIVGGGAKMVGGAAWLASKAGVAPDAMDSLQVGADTISKAMTESKSEQSRALSEYIAQQEDFWNTLGKAVDNPGFVADTISENIFMMLPGLGLANVAGKAGQVALTTKVAQNALANTGMKAAIDLSAKGATLPVLIDGIKAAQQAAMQKFVGGAATIGALAGEGLTSAGVTGKDVEQFILAQKPEELESNSPRYIELRKQFSAEYARRALASELSSDAAMKAGAWTTLVAGVTGSGQFMGNVATGAQRWTAKEGLKNTGKESLDETIQNPGEDYASYQAKAQVDPEQKFDIGSSAALGAVTGFGNSAGLNVLQGANAGIGSNSQRTPSATPPDKPISSPPQKNPSTPLSNAAIEAAKQGVTPPPIPSGAISAPELLGTPDATDSESPQSQLSKAEHTILSTMVKKMETTALEAIIASAETSPPKTPSAELILSLARAELESRTPTDTVSADYTPQPETEQRPTIEISPDLQPIGDNVEPPVAPGMTRMDSVSTEQQINDVADAVVNARGKLRELRDTAINDAVANSFDKLMKDVGIAATGDIAALRRVQLAAMKKSNKPIKAELENVLRAGALALYQSALDAATETLRGAGSNTDPNSVIAPEVKSFVSKWTTPQSSSTPLPASAPAPVKIDTDKTVKAVGSRKTPKPKRKAGTPKKMSMLQFVASIGGFNRASVANEFGRLDDMKRHKSGIFGSPTFRVNGGEHWDRIGEALAEAGYLPKNKHGQYDKADLEERLNAELDGEMQYTLDDIIDIAEHDKANREFDELRAEAESIGVDWRPHKTADDLYLAIEAKRFELNDEAKAIAEEALSRESVDTDFDFGTPMSASQTAAWLEGVEDGQGHQGQVDGTAARDAGEDNQRNTERGGTQSETQRQDAGGEFALTGQTEEDIRQQEERAADISVVDREAADRASEVPPTLAAQSSSNTGSAANQGSMFTLDGRASVAAEAKQQPAQKKDFRANLEKHFAIGNIIKSGYWGDYDRIESFNWNNGSWSVDVIKVKKNDDNEWVDAGELRNHSTRPDKRDVIVANVKNSQEAEQQADSKPADPIAQMAASVSGQPEPAHQQNLNDAPLASLAKKSDIGSYEIQPDSARNLPIDATELTSLRRAAASIESPERGITFTITPDGKAIVTGPARVKVPTRFQRFANEHGLTLVVQRADTKGFANSNTAMPLEYRESGALYFGEMGADHLDRTGKTRFSKAAEPKQTPQTVESITKATAKLRASWLGFKKIKIIQSAKEIPNELYLRALRAGAEIDSGTEGIYDPKTNTVYLIADNIASPERAVWVAIHEVVGHGGIRMLSVPVANALNLAARNGFVAKLARAIAADRGETFDAGTHTDEAIAELAAATITGNTDTILERYGVKVPMGMRSNLLGMIKRVVDAVRSFVGRVTGKPVEEVSDGEVLGLIRRMKEAAEGKAQKFDTAGVPDGVLASKSKTILREAANLKELASQSHQNILRSAKKASMKADTSVMDHFGGKFLFKLVGWNRIVEPAVDYLLERMSKFVPEKVKAGLVADYGLSGDYIDRKAEMNASKAAQNRKSAGLVEMLAALTRAESRIAYQWMQEKPDTATEQALLEKLPTESRDTLVRLKKMISDMGAEAVQMGQMSQEAYDRNNMAYLHRTYAKHVLNNEGAINKMLRARALKIKGNQYKGRGIFDEVSMDKIGGDGVFWRKLQEGQADKSLIGEKLIRFERRDNSADAMDALPGMESKPMGKLREVIYWPVSHPVPAKYGDWVNAGTFEVRDTKGDKLVAWRDFTPEERQRMGELDEVRYAVAQTLQMMTHDIETGRFFAWTAKTYGKAKPDRREKPASESMMHSFGKDEWVQVPSSSVPGTQTKKYGALAGLYVPGAIWNDIRQTAGTRIEPFGHIHEKVLQFWKKAKALALDTPIPTPDGWTTMGEIQVGDKIFDEKGQVCEVLHVTPVQLDRQCYEVAFSDGIKIVADKEHFWFTIMQKNPGVRTTKEILETLKEPTRGDNNHSIPLARELKLDDIDLPIPPYALGVWLGDGDTASTRVTAGGDDVIEIIGHVNESGIRCGLPNKDKRNNVHSFQMMRSGDGCTRGHEANNISKNGCRVCQNYSRGLRLKGLKLPAAENPNLQTKMRNLGLIGNKHIPVKYLRASGKQRRELLMGLMDTNGSMVETGLCSFVTILPKLRDTVLELLRSLGYKPTVCAMSPSCNGKAGKPAWRINFKAYSNAPVFKLARKKERQKDLPATKQRPQSRQIVAITPVPSVPVRCIAVSSESKLYLAGDGMVPTHNTAWSPAVHMNNVMANFVIADWHDLRAIDLAEALKVWAYNKRDGYREIYQRFEDSGALGGMFLSNEALRDEIAKQLESMKAELTGEQEASGEMSRMAKVMHLVTMAGMVPVKGAKVYTAKMESAYQFEDAIFRLAAFTKAIRHGKSDIEAGRIARNSFLNYDINAPWIQAARHTFLPFVSFFYRALPMALNTVKSKPWKVIKLLAFWQLVSAVGAMLSGGDDDEERKLLPKEKQGRVFGVVPKMVRMPWNHDDDAPYFLDIRRWVPVGDVADIEMGAGMLPPWATPGGPLIMLAEMLVANKSFFTEKEIVQDTDTQGEKLEKRLDHLFKGMMPNVPLPNPLNLQTPSGEINPLGLSQGSGQSYAWSGIERSMLKKEGQIGEVRNTPAAIASAFGVKAAAYPAGNMQAAQQIELRKKVDGIEDTMNKIGRNYNNLESSTEAEDARHERDMDRQQEKLQELRDSR